MGLIPIPGIFTCYMPGIGTIPILDLIMSIAIPDQDSYRYRYYPTDTGIGIGMIPIPSIGGTLVQVLVQVGDGWVGW